MKKERNALTIVAIWFVFILFEKKLLKMMLIISFDVKNSNNSFPPLITANLEIISFVTKAILDAS